MGYHLRSVGYSGRATSVVFQAGSFKNIRICGWAARNAVLPLQGDVGRCQRTVRECLERLAFQGGSGSLYEGSGSPRCGALTGLVDPDSVS